MPADESTAQCSSCRRPSELWRSADGTAKCMACIARDVAEDSRDDFV